MGLALRLRAGQAFLNNYGAGGGVELPFVGLSLSGVLKSAPRRSGWLRSPQRIPVRIALPG